MKYLTRLQLHTNLRARSKGHSILQLESLRIHICANVHVKLVEEFQILEVERNPVHFRKSHKGWGSHAV